MSPQYLCIFFVMVACQMVMVKAQSSPNDVSSASSVIFSVVRTSPITSGQDPVNITYDVIYANEGNGFDKESGHFVAPTTGYYVLYMSMASNASGKGAIVRMKHQNEIIVSAFQFNFGVGSNQVIRQLQAGDTVWTVLEPKYTAYSSGSRYMTFSGFLLH